MTTAAGRTDWQVAMDDACGHVRGNLGHRPRVVGDLWDAPLPDTSTYGWECSQCDAIAMADHERGA